MDISSEPDLRGELPVQAPKDLDRAIHLKRFGAKQHDFVFEGEADLRASPLRQELIILTKIVNT